MMGSSVTAVLEHRRVMLRHSLETPVHQQMVPARHLLVKAVFNGSDVVVCQI